MSLDHGTGFVKQQTASVDAFLNGRLSVAQPRDGFRAGLDSVLLGAAVDPGSARMLDLGSGVGVAALVALSWNGELGALLAEADREAVALARANLTANGMEARATVTEVDVTLRGAARLAAGLADAAFTSVIANPPFFANGTLPQAASRKGARHMGADALAAWVRTAAACCRQNGEVIFVHQIAALPVLLGLFAEKLGGLTLLPFSPRDGEPASRFLLRGIKGSRAPMRLLPSRPLHGFEGRGFAPEAEALFRGTDRLHW